jgi:NAD(P)-dependent dehydrogenase (short-subunit alcohol dehydrogenase family)
MSTESVSAPVALAVGADRGIGLETAWRLTGAGYRVYLTARTGERGRAAAATVGAQFLELDVTSDESVRHAAGCVEQAGGTWTYWSITPTSPARCVTRAATPRTT